MRPDCGSFDFLEILFNSELQGICIYEVGCFEYSNA